MVILLPSKEQYYKEKIKYTSRLRNCSMTVKGSVGVGATTDEGLESVMMVGRCVPAEPALLTEAVLETIPVLLVWFDQSIDRVGHWYMDTVYARQDSCIVVEIPV